MRQISKGVTVVGAIIALVLAAQSTAAAPANTVSTDYTVGALVVPGVETGLVLTNGTSVTVTATGVVCLLWGSFCMGPDGDSSYDTTNDGFLLPGAPAGGLVARVGNGAWVPVGSGPTTLSGSGELVFAVNDRYYPNSYEDNSGIFKVTVTYAPSRRTCYPGHGYGDSNHDHSGPPGLDPDPRWPGHGYGDSNHGHSGPPGKENPPSSEGSTTKGAKGRR